MHLRKFDILRSALLIICASGFLSVAHAQSEGAEDSSDLDQIEAEIGKSAPKEAPAQARRQEERAPEPQTISDLGKLSPFSEVSVIQRRYMPKTGRFQFNFGLGGLTNDPWFWGLGGAFRVAYHLTETWGVEGTGTFLSNSEKEVASDLYSNNNVSTSSLVTTKGYYGLDVFWSPIYGKMSLYNKRIIPFDMYFTAGGGQSEVGGAAQNNYTTLHLGTGQIYALSKSLGFRWDFSWNTYPAVQQDPNTGKKNNSQFNNLMLMFGFSYFYPEAKYR